MHRRHFLRLLVLGLGGWAVSQPQAAPIRVCGACGHEALGEETVCRHCGASLPPLLTETPAEPIASEPAEAAPSSPRLSDLVKVGVAAEELDWARRLAENGEGWGAIMAARNAMALAALEGDGDARVMADAAGLIQAVRQRLFLTRRVCPVCEGTGKKKIQMVTLKGEVLEQEMPSLLCESCGGSGFWRARPLATELTRDESAARRAFGVEQLRRARVESQGLWLPRGVMEALDVRGLVRVRRAAGLPCTACNGFGAISCATCQGAGRVRCTNRNCLHGTEICPDCRGTGRGGGSSGVSLTRCATCRGAGKRECQVCNGKGELPCNRCEGKGETLCAACRGAGEAPECARCGGQGFQVCARCGGAGVQRGAVCATCAGQGVVLCPACHGFGRAARR